MVKGRVLAALLVALTIGLGAAPAQAQFEDRHGPLPDPIPPPLPPRKAPEDAPPYEAIVPELPEIEWGLPADLVAKLRSKATTYQDFARQFTCDEVARVAEYDPDGQVDKEKRRRYAYLLLRDPKGETVREFRQELGRDGKVKGEVQDEEPFPPAYAWVFLFSEFHSPYFAYRLIDTRFDGFDLVHEIQFKGSLRFTSGKDIRQWEGRILVDAISFTPLEILAEPTGQRERVEAMYRAYTQSFNLLGFRTKPRPLSYRALIEFRLRRATARDEAAGGRVDDYLRFPTELRYDTNRAVSPNQFVAVRASTRSYERYRFVDVGVTPEMGDVVNSPQDP